MNVTQIQARWARLAEDSVSWALNQGIVTVCKFLPDTGLEETKSKPLDNCPRGCRDKAALCRGGIGC